LTAKVVGAGVTAKEAARSQALFNFVRNTAAGTIQFSGTAEEFGEVPSRAAAGAAFGAAIEGIFLGRAMLGRRGAVNKASLLDDGNPVPDVPVDVDRMVSEIEISPSTSKTAERMAQELDGTFTQNKPYNEVITDLLSEHIETARFTGLSREGADDILAYAKTNFPSAQRLSRVTQAKGVYEAFIHQPFDPSGRLTKKQLEQWKATGYAAGEQLTYANRPYAATGVPVAEGFVQLRDPFSRRPITFAAPVEEVTRPITTHIFPQTQVVEATRNSVLRQAVADIDNRIGFVVPASTVGRGAALSARRGFVDVSEFATAPNFREFAKQFTDDLASVQAATPEEAVGILAERAGIPGLRIVDEGVTTRVHIFDQKKVGFVSEPPAVKTSAEVRDIGIPPTSLLAPGRVGEPLLRPFEEGAALEAAQILERQALLRQAPEAIPSPTEIPNLGLILDDAVMSQAGEIQSFVPSWKNSISAPLREAGIPEKEIQQFLDLYSINTSRRLDALMDPEFQAIKNASEIQFGGCP